MKNILSIIFLVCLNMVCLESFSQNKSSVHNYFPATLTITSTKDSICPGEIVSLTASLSGGGTYVWSPGGATTSSLTVSLITTQTYTVVATQGAIRDSGTITITVIPLPTPLISGESFECRGIADTLMVNSSNGPTTYIWSNGNTTTTYITGPIDADSIISVTGYNALGCSHDTSFRITVILPPCTQGINEIQLADQFYIFPNPNNGIFTIVSEFENGKSLIEIYNILGEKVFTEALTTTVGDNSINISSKPSGIYFYRILKEDNTLLDEGKFIVK